jgi:hypothetical protein
MSKVSVHVWHSANGKILAVGRPMIPQDFGLKAVPVTGKDHFVLETEVSEDLINALWETHLVDVEKKVLVEAPARVKHEP